MADMTKAQLEEKLAEVEAKLAEAQAGAATPDESAAKIAELEAQLAQAHAETAEANAGRAAAEQRLAEAQVHTTDTQGTAAVPKEPDPGDELVPVRLFKDNHKYKDDVFVAVNGQSVQIQRGKTVMVKKKFADVLEQSMAQDEATASLIERESREYEEKAKALGV